jgi:hypothetical protein
MLVDNQAATIKLSTVEVNVFLDREPATQAMLMSEGPYPYKRFSQKVEYAAEGIYIATERAVVITNADTGGTIATYDECGLSFIG